MSKQVIVSGKEYEVKEEVKVLNSMIITDGANEYLLNQKNPFFGKIKERTKDLITVSRYGEEYTFSLN